MSYFAGIEAGGTKFIVGIGNAQGHILDQATIATKTPDETMPKVLAYFKQAYTKYPFQAMGVGAFGPLELDFHSPSYGSITSTPKLAWREYHILQALKAEWGVPMGFDTDVTAAALAEGKWGGAQGLNNYLYITVGTGIGAGVIQHGKPVHGLIHPEVGHMLIPCLEEDREFPGVCPYHIHCLEGMAAGPAIKARWSVDSALDLPPDHPAWEKEAHYLAIACANLMLTLSPQKIILGGGVMKQTQLFPKIREKTKQLLAGYLSHTTISDGLTDIIVPATLGTKVGICGAIALACHAQTQSGNEERGATA